MGEAIEDSRDVAPSYNPELVSFVTDEDRAEIPVVTRQATVDYVKDNDLGRSGVLRSAYSQIEIAIKICRGIYDIRDYVYYDENGFAGVRADKFAAFVEALALGDVRVYRVGKEALDLLAKIADALQLEAQEQY